MSSEGSVTHWLGQLQAGDPAAVQRLWERYFADLVGLARQRLRGAPRRAADEEDVALSAFDSFCRGAAAGRFPLLADRANLWRLLFTLTMQKTVDLVRAERRQKRGGGAVLDEAALLALPGLTREPMDLGQVLSHEPPPALAAQMAEECQRLLGGLDDAGLQAVALAKMEGYTNEEVAARLGCSLRSVERKLGLIRRIWEREGTV